MAALVAAPLTSSLEDQVRFCAELATMFVGTAGFAYNLAGPGLVQPRRAVRAAAALAFAVAAAAALVHGSGLAGGGAGHLIGLARLGSGGLVAMLAATVHPVPGWRGRAALVGGLLWAAAGGVSLAPAGGALAESLLAAGTVAIGFALVLASGQSVAARMTANGAATLLLVVLVISMALSAVISATVQREELTHLESRASAEVADMGEVTGMIVEDARSTAGDLAGYFHGSDPDPLLTLGGPATGSQASASAAVAARLRQLSALNPAEALLYTPPGGGQAAASAGLPPGAAAALARFPGLSRLTCGRGGQGSVLVAAGEVWAIGALPECLSGSGRQLGVVVVAQPLGAAYLMELRSADPTISLALVGPASVLATAGPQPPRDVILAVPAGAAPSIHGDREVTATVVPVAAGGGSVHLVLSTSTSQITASRDRLMRDLFLIALGGAVLALGVSSLTAERITAGIRRLTHVSGRIQDGDTSERAGISAGDEIGRLGASFDAMLDSVEAQTAALQAAAEDEARLRDRLEAVVAGMGDALIALDAGGRITDYNQAAAELTGVRVGEALGRPAAETLDLVGDDGRPLGDELRHPTPRRWSRLGSLRRPDGTDVPVGVSAGALRGPAGEVVGSVLVMRDLRREHELEAMKNEFLARVGHELRTPLTGIMGYAEILLRRDVPAPRARAWNEEILAGAKRLLRIVEMLEFFASSVAGRQLLQREPIDPRSLLNGVVASWTDRLPDGCSVVRRIARTTPPVLADRRWLALAVDELIDNAVKFSPAGGRILVSAGPACSVPGGPEDLVEISVTDRGRGMTAEEQAVVFGEFVQGDPSDTRHFGGLGLGLALVQRVAEGHGGSVVSRSAVGRGSTFTIRLPMWVDTGAAITHAGQSTALR